MAILTRACRFFSPSFEENEGISYGKLLGHEHSLVSWFKTALAARCSEEEKKDYLWLIPAGVCALQRGKGYNEED